VRANAHHHRGGVLRGPAFPAAMFAPIFPSPRSTTTPREANHGRELFRGRRVRLPPAKRMAIMPPLSPAGISLW